jgi:arylsulfatase A-like enzyme
MGQQKAKKRYYPPITQKILPENNKVPYVFLIVLDTVRADSLSIYGGNPMLGLHLEQFAKDALVFENCIASSSWTMPSHASMFTGLYPREHGTHKHITKNKSWYAPIKLPTLADIFHENKYNTFAIVSNFAVLRPNVFGKGFDIYDCADGLGKNRGRTLNPLINLFCYETNINPKYFSPYRTAEDINSSTKNLLADYYNSPSFLFLNFMDAHLPYFPPRTFNRLFTTAKLSLLYRIKFARSFFWDIPRKFLNKSQYNSEIAYLDHQLGKLFAHLKKIGIYDKSLIVITSDHGELFNEHKLWGHRQPMYEGIIKVPLLVKFPYSLKTGREKKLFALSDLFSLILETCNLHLPESFSKPNAQRDTSFVVSELYAHGKIGDHRVIYDGRYKLMKYSKGKPIELYDLEKDPKERVNLAKELPKITEELLNKLTEWEQNHKPLYQEPQNKPVISEEIKNDMRALGYVE